jgi:glyoxylase-like metal-dependent hydrolase (beta-lactamase superfamily II)
MIFSTTGQAAPGFWVLGTAQVPSYLFTGQRPALVDAGFSCLGPLYQQDADQVLGGRPPALLLLTHVHFDHCGAAAWLKRAYPGLVIAASARAAQIVQRPNALALMERLSQQAAEAMRAWGQNPSPEAAFAPFAVEMILEDGQEVDLGQGRVLQVLHTPGHTWDFLSYHLPAEGILVASEAVGCADSAGKVVTEFLVDFDAYLESLNRLAALKPRVLAQGHRVVYTGQDAADYLARAQAAAPVFKALVERLLYEHHGDVEKVVGVIKAQEYDPTPVPRQPEPAYLINLTARVSRLAAAQGVAK